MRAGKIGVLPRVPVPLNRDDHDAPISLDDGKGTSTAGGSAASHADSAKTPATTTTQPTPISQPHLERKNSDDSELEYADNPFEDEDRK